MFAMPDWKYPEFELKDLHKKIVQLSYFQPTESDIAEGNFMAQLWARDEKGNLYLIVESDVREKATDPKWKDGVHTADCDKR